ncbi:MAG: hypothetical protein Tsb009_00300 [Planctomycetaceae bacterium]
MYPLTLPDETGSEKRYFVKLNWGRRRFWPRMTDIKTGQIFQSLPTREWHGLNRFEQIGLNVPERIALFREGLLHFRDAVIVREVPPLYSVDEMLQNGEWEKLTLSQQSNLLAAIMDILRTIHLAGLGWRGSSSRHFYPQLDPDGCWKIWLIDCEGVHRSWSRKVILRDCDKLWRAMRESCASHETLTELGERIGEYTGKPFSRVASRRAA